MRSDQDMIKIFNRIALVQIIIGLGVFFFSFGGTALNDNNLPLMIAIGVFVAAGFISIMISFLSAILRKDVMKD